MKFYYGKQEMRTLDRAQENCFLVTNGLGGYASVSAAYSVPRCDQGILVAAVKAPNERITMVHRIREVLTVGDKEVYLSSQGFADGTQEDGYNHLSAFTYEYVPEWTYHVSGIRVKRTLAMALGKNTTAVVYTFENNSGKAVTFKADPFFKFAPKETALEEKQEITFVGGAVTGGGYTVYIRANASVEALDAQWQTLAYPEDAKDGRPEEGMAGTCCRIIKTVAPGETAVLEIIFSMTEEMFSGEKLVADQKARLKALAEKSGFAHPVARQLAVAADAYIAHRDSTNGKTILAGYPLFSDWGRDTMIALPGCCLAASRFDDARSILRTFLAYERDGLVPNLFPEGEAKPMYNTVDAALLLIDSVWQYIRRSGDWDFLAEAMSVMERIVENYQRGTHHAIGMDSDGLIFAGDGLDQVTWMDVRVNDILPTPRHGKPVEINANWYNALRIMALFAEKLGKDGSAYEALAEKVKASFLEKFYMEDKGYLKDVISGTKSDTQIRCNQIWAVSMPFTMLSHDQAKSVVETVQRHLHTPCGLRTLSPEDPEYKPTYGGPMLQRDLAYHQGTTWVFPMGAYYLAYLKVHGHSPEVAERVREELEAMEAMLREGCAGQLPEIYDGECPREGKGCFAQAWSVGEMLRVYEALETVK